VYETWFSPDGSIIFSGSQDQKICAWDVQTSTQLQEVKLFKNSVKGVTSSLDGSLVASNSNNDMVHVWDTSEVHRLGRRKDTSSVVQGPSKTKRARKATAKPDAED